VRRLVSGPAAGTALVNATATNTTLEWGLIACGRTLLGSASTPEGLPLDHEVGTAAEGPITTLMPDLWTLSRDLSGLAAETLPVLLLGETGVGKERLARALHRTSGRSGSLVVVDAGERIGNGNGESEHALGNALAAAAGGTLLIEHVDRLPEHAQATFIRALDTGYDVRVMATSSSTRQDPTFGRLLAHPGHRHAAALRERIGDSAC
jgi:DNA-binding NtrC family response regulator